MNDWQMFGLLVSLMVAFDALSLFANRFIVTKAVTSQKDQYKDKLEAATKECADLANRVRDYQKIEREVLELKADLPVSYVRKEDFIRHEVAINAKLDRIYEVLSNQKKGEC